MWLLVLLACSEDPDDVLPGLRSDNPTLREDAVMMSGDYDDAEVIAELDKLLADPDPRIRKDAIDALAELGAVGSLDKIAGLAQDPDPDVARSAIDALGRFADPKAGPALITVIQGDPENPPLNALWAVGACKVKDARPILVALRDHPDKWVRYNANEALRAIDAE